jgi:hypothetical protein
MRSGQLCAQQLVFEGELVDDSHEFGHVGSELDEFLVLVRDRLLELGDLLAEPCLGLGWAAAFLDLCLPIIPSMQVRPLDNTRESRRRPDPAFEG